MRRMTGRSTACMALIAWVGTACGPECEDQRECATGQACEMGVCVASIPGGNPRPTPDDAGVPPDSGPAPLDAGDASTDAMPADGAIDGGTPRPDAEVRDGAIVPSLTSRGFVWAGELRADGGSAYHAYGELLDESSVQYDDVTTTYPDSEAGECQLRVRRLISGAPMGWDAMEIQVVPGPQPFSSFSMLPVGNGRFEPAQDPVARIYSQSANAQFLVRGSGAARSVADLQVVVPAPPTVFELNPPENGDLFLVGGVPIQWVPSGAAGARITAEVYDANREVVLSCATGDDGSYTLPSSAVGAFLNQTPMVPWTFEIRHDREMAGTAVVSGISFPVTFRASWGARFSAR